MEKIGKNVVQFIRIIIALAAYGFVAYRLKSVDWSDLTTTFSHFSSTTNLLLFFVFLFLMPVNWLLESQKWRIVLYEIENINLTQALKAVWYGVVTGLLTPNRVGEPLGRMAMVSAENRGKAAFLAIFCGVSQQVVTLVVGVFGILHLMLKNKNFYQSVSTNSLFFVGIFIATTIFIILLFNFNLLVQFLQANKLVKKVLSDEQVNLKITLSKTVSVLTLSIFRYLIFSTQFFLMLRILGMSSDFTSMFAAIFSTYLFTNIVPTISLSEAGVRAGFAITVFGLFSQNYLAVTLASFIIWGVNVGIPAVIAAWFPWFKRNAS